MIRFDFRLTPLDEVGAWGRKQPTLHWFGLTDGKFRIDAGGRELLFDVDYYVVRLWEDVNVLTPSALEAVPADLEDFAGLHSDTWARNPLELVVADAPDDHPALVAMSWYCDRWLPVHYLQNGPDLRFWRNSRDQVIADQGDVRVVMPAEEYLSAVRTLDRELFAAMDERVAEVERRGGLPGIDIDLSGLRREHEDRRQWLAKSFAREPVTDWAAIREGARWLIGDHLAG